jgi:hypothetical protein
VAQVLLLLRSSKTILLTSPGGPFFTTSQKHTLLLGRNTETIRAPRP